VAKRTPCHRAKRRYITTDTEYLGTIHGVPVEDALSLTTHNYVLVKANVNELPALQLELTICDEDDNRLIVINNNGCPLQQACEFNFYDFNVAEEDVEASRPMNGCTQL
jgi:CCR4-NOT transcription complex subunit 7/8